MEKPDASGSDSDNSEKLGVDELSSSALAALKDFLAGQSGAAERAKSDPFGEDWGMSQFWYDERTATVLAAEVARLGGRVACIACPSLFRQLRRSQPQVDCHLLEFDRRFEQLGAFSFYDYNEPLALPAALCGAFDVVVADPPYLADSCLSMTAQTVRLLRRAPDSPVLVLTGASVRAVARRELGALPCRFRPEHSCKLGNEFLCYSSYEPAGDGLLGGWDRGEFPELFE